MSHPQSLPRYDSGKTYDWNYAHAPARNESSAKHVVPSLPGNWQFCGLPVGSPLGVAAGPLLNGKWCLYYAGLGFDVVTYKTVRSRKRECYAVPNLVPVDCEQLDGSECGVTEAREMQGSWAVSFGMPSQAPEVWRADVRWTREQLAPHKLLSVSVVGSVRDGWTTANLAEDYARSAKWAVESGADVIETNFSCPNVTTSDGQLFHQPDDAQLVAERVRAAIGEVPLIVKIGHVKEADAAARLLDALAPSVNALAMTNSLATTVCRPDGTLHFSGQVRGICGSATLSASARQVAMFRELIEARQTNLQLVGVGGAGSAADVRRYVNAGAHAVHLATAAMVNPGIALDIRRDWGGCRGR